MSSLLPLGPGGARKKAFDFAVPSPPPQLGPFVCCPSSFRTVQTPRLSWMADEGVEEGPLLRGERFTLTGVRGSLTVFLQSSGNQKFSSNREDGGWPLS